MMNKRQRADGISEILASRGCGMAPDDRPASPMMSHQSDPVAKPLITLAFA
jgi:hypothetical protein